LVEVARVDPFQVQPRDQLFEALGLAQVRRTNLRGEGSDSFASLELGTGSVNVDRHTPFRIAEVRILDSALPPVSLKKSWCPSRQAWYWRDVRPEWYAISTPAA